MTTDEKELINETLPEETPQKKTPKHPRLHNEVYRDKSQCGKRKDGSTVHHDCWRVDISIVNPDGTITRTRKRFKTENEARAFHKEINIKMGRVKKKSKRKSVSKRTTAVKKQS